MKALLAISTLTVQHFHLVQLVYFGYYEDFFYLAIDDLSPLCYFILR